MKYRLRSDDNRDSRPRRFDSPLRCFVQHPSGGGLFTEDSIVETKVWIRKRSCKPRHGRAVTTYHLRWVCPQERTWKSRKVGTDSKRAQAELVKLEAELEAGTCRSERSITWANFAAEHVRRVPGAAHRDDHERTLRFFSEAGDPQTPRHVSFCDVERFVDWLRERKNATATVNKRLDYLNNALTMAVKRGYVTVNPMADWTWEREDEKEVRALTDAEKAKLLAACDTHQLKTMVLVALRTGCRLNELLTLEWRRVDFDNARAFIVHTKAKRNRYQPLCVEAVAMLRELQASTLADGGPFRSIRTRSKLQKLFTKAVKAAGIEHCTFHDLRRTFCTDLARVGVNQLVVQKLAGYSSQTTTAKYYQHIDDPMKRDAVDKLRRTAG